MPVVTQALKIRLAASGYSVRRAVDGKTAMSQAPAEPPDLIILDLGPPDHDGYAVMERLKASPNTASIPIIVLTGRDQAINQLSAYELGAVDFFQKPVSCKWFSAAIERAQAIRAKADKPGGAV
jgi:DNA-binding response OmpR family regulator